MYPTASYFQLRLKAPIHCAGRFNRVVASYKYNRRKTDPKHVWVMPVLEEGSRDVVTDIRVRAHTEEGAVSLALSMGFQLAATPI